MEYPGGIYPVMNRVDWREPIVRDDTDRECFVETLVTVEWISERLKMRMRNQHEHTSASITA